MNEFFEKIIFHLTLFHKRVKNVPGAFIESLSKDTRNKLKELKSNDLVESSYRKDVWRVMASTTEFEQKKENKQLLLDFDKKLK